MSTGQAHSTDPMPYNPPMRTIHAFIRSGENFGFVGECPLLHAVTQGTDLDEVVANLQEVIGLALEGEDLEELGLAEDPVILVTLEVQPAVA